MSAPTHNDPRRSAEIPFLKGDRVRILGWAGTETKRGEIVAVGSGYWIVDSGDDDQFAVSASALELETAIDRLGGVGS